jgi:N-methylhydantoinase B
VVFAGYQTEKPFLMLEFHNVAGAGGGPQRDGQDAGPYCLGNTANVPVEVIEAENPVRVTRYGFLPDTEGAGQYRGALGIVREYELLAENATVQLRSDRQKHPPYGLRGWRTGAAARVVMNPGRADERVLQSKFVMTMGRGDVLSGELPGSGGWSNAMKRDPAAVLEDVRQGKVPWGEPAASMALPSRTTRRFVSNRDLSPLHRGQFGIERIAQPVTEQVEGQHDQHHCDAWEHGDPP